MGGKWQSFHEAGSGVCSGLHQEWKREAWKADPRGKQAGDAPVARMQHRSTSGSLNDRASNEQLSQVAGRALRWLGAGIHSCYR